MAKKKRNISSNLSSIFSQSSTANIIFIILAMKNGIWKFRFNKNYFIKKRCNFAN